MNLSPVPFPAFLGFVIPGRGKGNLDLSVWIFFPVIPAEIRDKARYPRSTQGRFMRMLVFAGPVDERIVTLAPFQNIMAAAADQLVIAIAAK